MAKSKYSGDQEIRHKIDELFSYRKLSDLLERGGLDKDIVFTIHLTEIQYQIYLLDAYLEGEWTLDQEKLNGCWEAIKGALAGLGYKPEQALKLLHEIRDYERIERNCRKGKWPTKVSFKKFYTTKSCDVRLIRHLIYDARPELSKIWKENAWVYYDLITEINDDIADLREDLLTYNGNRFLISCLRKGKQKTSIKYKAYLEKVSLKAKKYFRDHAKDGENGQLASWTIARSKETLELLDKTSIDDDVSLFGTSLILGKMK